MPLRRSWRRPASATPQPKRTKRWIDLQLATELKRRIDEDDKRLTRYLNEMKCPFPVARLTAEQAAKTMGFDNVPATFYVDAGRRRPVLPERIRVAQRLANARELVHRSTQTLASIAPG